VRPPGTVPVSGPGEPVRTIDTGPDRVFLGVPQMIPDRPGFLGSGTIDTGQDRVFSGGPTIYTGRTGFETGNDIEGNYTS
jgi:hypothetical protein